MVIYTQTMSDCTSTYYTDQKAKFEAQLAALNTAILKAIVKGYASYTVDSGQSMQQVKVFSLDQLRLMQRELETQYANVLNNCHGPSIGIPAF